MKATDPPSPVWARGNGAVRCQVNSVNYVDFYYLEKYLFEQVGPRFCERGTLRAFDFFCIVIWKANRAKSKVATRLLSITKLDDLESSVEQLRRELSSGKTRKARMRVLIENWKLRLPMASAILTVLYPRDFTVYDVRVVGVVKLDDKATRNRLLRLADERWSDSLWLGYEKFVESVKKSAPAKLPLRDKDRWLWGKSVYLQLTKDIGSWERSFKKTPQVKGKSESGSQK